MRGGLMWPAVVGGAMLAGCIAILVMNQRQFQQQMTQMRQEILRLEARQQPLEPGTVEDDPTTNDSTFQFTDTRLLRRIFLDDLREQLAQEESDEVASRLLKSWFE
jgi:hypothetical protein